jgi:tetratricopeptide (TPR) repeat protein
VSILIVLSLLSSCATKQPLTVTELLNLGEKYLLEHNYEQALVQFILVIEIEPSIPNGYKGAANAYIGLNRLDDAERVLQEGLVAIPDNIDMREALAELYIEQSRLSEAITLIENGLRYDQNNIGLQELHEELLRLTHTHSWLTASCLSPKTCQECLEEEGLPLEHIWIEANFQDPQTCIECGKTEGEAIDPIAVPIVVIPENSTDGSTQSSNITYPPVHYWNYGGGEDIVYNSNGDIVKVSYYDVDGIFVGWSDFQRAVDHFQLVRIDYWYENGSLSYYVINELGTNGEMIVAYFHALNGDLLETRYS